jgi:hypothetical protein
MVKIPKSWWEELQEVKAKMQQEEQTVDPWRLRLERLRGDILGIPQRSRGAGACRRLAKLMTE